MLNNQSSPLILYIEDDPASKMLVRKLLENGGYQVIDADTGISGIKMALFHHPSLILVDINIPELNGYETSTKLKSISQLKNIPIVALTANNTRGDKERSLAAGCDGHISKPIDTEHFLVAIDDFLHGKKEQINTSIERRFFIEYREKLVDRLESTIRELREKNLLLIQKNREMEETYVSVMQTLMRALEAKHEYTAGHSERVTFYALNTARILNLNQTDQLILRRASQLHDIGKLVIDLSSINKPGKLSDEEWELMREHPNVGAAILSPLKFLEREAFLVRHHHEREDGKGFPDGLGGKDLDLLTSILSVADSFDAMTSNRPYQKRRAFDMASQELLNGIGTKYKQEAVDAFIETLLIESTNQSFQ